MGTCLQNHAVWKCRVFSPIVVKETSMIILQRSGSLEFSDLPLNLSLTMSTIVHKLPRTYPSIHPNTTTSHHQESLHSSNTHGPEGDHIRRNSKSISDTMFQHNPNNTKSQTPKAEKHEPNYPQLPPIPTLDEL